MNAQTNRMAAGNETQRGIRDTSEEFFGVKWNVRVQARVFSFNLLRVMSAHLTDVLNIFSLKRVLRGQLGS